MTMPPDADGTRARFFNTLFGNYEGYVCIAILPKNMRGGMDETFFHWPDQEDQINKFCGDSKHAGNVYVCPQVLSGKRRTKENIISTPTAWADLDLCNPENLLVPPTVAVESSPGRWQAYWRFAGVDNVDPDDAEDLSKRIAYKHADEGADRSGWDLTQLLRVPYTYNYKYTSQGGIAPVVAIVGGALGRYRMEDFAGYPSVEGYRQVDIPLPDLDPDANGQAVLDSKQGRFNQGIWPLFVMRPDEDWSRKLWQLETMCAEAGFTPEETFVVARDAGCNKYARDGKSQRLLWKDVIRAHDKFHFNTLKLTGEATDDNTEVTLLTDEERQEISQQPPTFVERYTEWARSLGDAAPQYHQAGAFIALSSLLAGAVRLPTSFGTIIPNLWFMILADTTLTRKSTAMDIAMDLVADVDPDAMMATDGSLEGLMTSLAGRPGRPSVFLRDEFSGLLESMTKKDYMAGMAELLTKLYDGKTQKRLLRKEVITVKDPVLIIFAGGIKNKITSLLTYEQVSSGFMPRFVFITAESDPSSLKPLGPPTGITLDTKKAIRDELVDLTTFYWQQQPVAMELGGTQRVMNQPMSWDAELTPQAWARYNKLESDLIDLGLKHERPDVMTPTYDRLSKSILKASVLLAASRQRGVVVVVEEADIVRAIGYGEQWRMHAVQIIEGVGKTQNERQLDVIMNAIYKKPGVTRSVLMQHYHLDARTATAVFETLEERGLITRQKQGRTYVFYPTRIGVAPNV
jgi:predicted transcriptional regulator